MVKNKTLEDTMLEDAYQAWLEEKELCLEILDELKNNSYCYCDYENVKKVINFIKRSNF